MNILNTTQKYIIDSQLYVSLMGTFFAVFFMLEQNIIKFPTIVLIFITYFSGYIYTKYQNSGKIFNYILIFNVICGIASVVLILLLHNENRLFKWMIIVILGLLYDSKFLKYFVRNIPLFKIFYVGLTWALINSWLILPHFDWAVFGISWIFITALVLPFDIRDMDSDKIITFPRLIGVQNTKYLAYILVFMSLILSIEHMKTDYAVAFLITCIFTYLLIYFSEKTNQDFYFSFWVESCSALPLLIVILLKYF